MSEPKYKTGTLIEFPMQTMDIGDVLYYRIIDNCKLPRDICIKVNGIVYSYDEDFLNENAKIITEQSPNGVIVE